MKNSKLFLYSTCSIFVIGIVSALIISFIVVGYDFIKTVNAKSIEKRIEYESRYDERQQKLDNYEIDVKDKDPVKPYTKPKQVYVYSSSSSKKTTTDSGKTSSSSSSYSNKTSSSSSSKKTYNTLNCDPEDYDDPDDYAEDAWGDDFDDYVEAYDFWEDY